MPFIHDIGLEEEGIYQNWYPKNKNFIVRDNHSTCSYSISFETSDTFTMPASDQNCLYTMTVPLGIRCKATLLYYEGEPWKVRLTQLSAEEVAVEEGAHHTGRSRMYFQEQSAQQDSSSH